MILNWEIIMIKRRFILLLVILAGLSSCEERFNPELKPTSQSLIVVDGQINNLPGPYTVKLSLSTALESPLYLPLSGFSVSITDNTGFSESLFETVPGEYQTSNGGIQGIIGRQYKVVLVSPEGEHYESTYETLREPTAIDSVYPQLEFQTSDDLLDETAGYRFYLNTKEAPQDSAYFLWQLVSTFKYRSDFNIYWVYEGYLRPVDDYDSLRICYKTANIQEIFLFSTANLQPPVLNSFPLHYVTTDTRELMERYSLLVRQYSISEETYKFWRIVKDQNLNMGDLYSKQPFQVKGNVYRTGNSNEIVLGNFMVAGVTEKRIFVNRPDPHIQFRYPVCEFNEDVYRNFAAIVEFPPTSWPIFATRGPLGNALPNQWCMDCRQSGGVIEKPDFWIE